LFERDHHRLIADVLESLDADRLRARQCWFGGGTAIALRYGEYRESVDIDFLTSSIDGYRELRTAITGAAGLAAITRPDRPLETTGELRADQYGIRARVRAGEVAIKLEIVHEGRIQLDPPGPDDVVCGVATLSPLDLAAEKLLANSDRGRDDAAFARDVIDLAIMAQPRPELRASIDKAAGAYGTAIERDLLRSIAYLREHPNRLEQYMRAMRMTMPRALLWSRIRTLERRARGAGPTKKSRTRSRARAK
jgi:hypothetical protein